MPAELPERLQTVVQGYFLEERPMADIADELGVSESRISQMRGEALTLLELAPRRDSPVRARFDSAAVESALDALAAGQAEDGGWTFDWLDWSATTTGEWRARLTVDALATLRDHSRL